MRAAVIGGKGHTAIAGSGCQQQHANRDNQVSVGAKGQAEWTVLEGSCHPKLDIDKEESSYITWAKLWYQQWLGLGSTRTLMPRIISCRVGRLSGLLGGLNDLSKDNFHKSEKRQTQKPRLQIGLCNVLT